MLTMVFSHTHTKEKTEVWLRKTRCGSYSIVGLCIDNVLIISGLWHAGYNFLHACTRDQGLIEYQ